MVGFEEAAFGEPAPGGDVFVGAEVIGGELEDLAGGEGLDALPEQDDDFAAAHVTGVPMVGYGEFLKGVHSGGCLAVANVGDGYETALYECTQGVHRTHKGVHAEPTTLKLSGEMHMLPVEELG